jgi:vancomycin resistance protein YoaR
MAGSSLVRLGVGVVGCAAVAGAALVLTQPASAGPGTLRDNLYLAGVPVGGKPLEEIEGIAAELSRRLLAVPVRVAHGKLAERTTAAKLGATCDPKAAAAAARAASDREPNFFERLRGVFAGPERLDVPLPVAVSDKGVAKGLSRFSIRIGKEPKNARVTKVKGAFKVLPAKPGKEIDSTAVAAALQTALDDADFRAGLAEGLETEPERAKWLAARKPILIAATQREAKPRITEEDVRSITGTLASFSTGLGASSRNRRHNVALACAAINGTVLMPGDVFSYNDVVGPRVPSAGYREAPVIVRGRLEPGTGGGICQVSSTLYNAALLADLQIVSRRNHGIPVAYVPAGRDATVADGAIDFKFKNRLERPIAIGAAISGWQVVVSVYGHPDDRREVEILRSGIGTIGAGVRTVSDPRLARGRRVVERPAQSGRRVTVTRIVKKDGQVLRREVVSRDYYRAYEGVVRVGTRAPAPARTATMGNRSEAIRPVEPEPPSPTDGE